jgi:hypothetical protein
MVYDISHISYDISKGRKYYSEGEYKSWYLRNMVCVLEWIGSELGSLLGFNKITNFWTP